MLALLFLWAEGRIDESGGLTAFAAEWATRRPAPGSGAASAPSDAPDDPPDDAPAGDAPKAQTAEQRLDAEKRAGQRDERVRTGMVELDRWLDDQVTAGIAATTRHGYPAAQEMAARMVDAQAPAVASRLRDLALLPSSGRDWPDRLVAALGLLHLLAQGTARLDELSPDLRHTVRLRLGYTTPRLEVLGTEPVVDRWAVVGLRDSDEELVSMRRVWLPGRPAPRRTRRRRDRRPQRAYRPPDLPRLRHPPHHLLRAGPAAGELRWPAERRLDPRG